VRNLFSNISFEEYQQQMEVASPDSSLRSSSRLMGRSKDSKQQLIRNPMNGKLTLKAHELIQQRLFTCSAKDLDAQKVFSSDPLNLPICSYEIFPKWTQWLITKSKKLNAQYALPVNPAFIHNHWDEIYAFYYKELMKEMQKKTRVSKPGAASTTTTAGTEQQPPQIAEGQSRPNRERAGSSSSNNNSNSSSSPSFVEGKLLFYPRLYSVMLKNCFRFNLRFIGIDSFLITFTVSMIVMMLKYGGFQFWGKTLLFPFCWLLYLVNVYYSK
jgi:hypothetical protein